MPIDEAFCKINYCCLFPGSLSYIIGIFLKSHLQYILRINLTNIQKFMTRQPAEMDRKK